MNYTRGVPFIIFKSSEAGVPVDARCVKEIVLNCCHPYSVRVFHFVTFCAIGGVCKVHNKDISADWLILRLVSVLRT